MLYTIIMILGAIVGYFWFAPRWLPKNTLVQLFSTVFLIFCMGVSLGGRADFAEKIVSMGFVSLIYAVVPIAFSVLFVYFLSRRFLGGDKK